ncbi:MAG: hypothetical protein ACRDMH_01065 [Solirubrobacterales bacterium]
MRSLVGLRLIERLGADRVNADFGLVKRYAAKVSAYCHLYPDQTLHQATKAVMPSLERRGGSRKKPQPRAFHAQMLPNGAAGDGSVSSDLLSPTTNGWQASNGHTTFWIYAGAAPYSQGRLSGRFLIVWNHESLGNSPDEVNVPGAGALRITEAPVGELKGSNRPRADLQFTSKKGVTGTLHLPSDTLSLTGGMHPPPVETH